MGEALLFALGERLGDEFSPEAAEAWSKAYGFISATMISHTKEASAKGCVLL